MLRTINISNKPSFLVRLSDEERFRRVDGRRDQILANLEGVARCFQVGVELISECGKHERVWFTS